MKRVLTSVNDLISANVRWAIANRWAVELGDEFPNLPPFDRFFPAETVDEKISNVNDGQFTIGHHQFRYPQDRISKELSITFLDDDRFSLMETFRAWMDELVPPSKGVLGLLKEYARTIRVYRYGWEGSGNRRIVTDAREYLVYPSGMITYSGSQSPEFIRFTIELAVLRDKII